MMILGKIIFLLMVLITTVQASDQCFTPTEVTGGAFEFETYRNSDVIKALNHTGPKGCIRECLYQSGCTSVNYKSDHTCELLKESVTDEKYVDSISYYSNIALWNMTSNQCWPNPCSGSDRCVVAKYGHHVCLPVPNPCENNHCLYGGSCRNAINGVRCACAEGYSGDKCEITPCASSPCYNAGICSPNGPSFLCKCPAGFSGFRCQVSEHVIPMDKAIFVTVQQNSLVYAAKVTYNAGNVMTIPEHVLPIDKAISVNVHQDYAAKVTYLSGKNESVPPTDKLLLCMLITPCTSKPCINGGTCSISGSTYKCTCPAGYSGTTCQVTPCTTNYCQYGGTCVINGASYTCKCAAGYSGNNCQITPCTTNYCQYGGTCVINGASYTCKCAAGYSGNNCQNTPCTTNQCTNGATCVITDSYYSCRCPSGYSGNICQVTPCTYNPCQNGGSCTISYSSYTCTCYGGYSGSTCQTPPAS